MTHDQKYTAETIASSDTVFYIPLYQRLFEWGEEQINGLITDLHEQFKDNYRNKTQKDYYIGMLTATHNNELVDGQQRFTVMMLIGIAFQEILENKIDNTWGQFLASSQNEQGLRLRFKARPNDEEYLKHLIFNTTFSKENVKMSNGLKYIKDFLAKHSREELLSFSEFIFEHLAFFITYLPTDYEGEDLNKYFETMNAGGKGLENYEILKVELLRNADEQEKKTWIWNKVAQLDKLLLWKNKEYNKENLLEDTRTQFANKEISIGNLESSETDNNHSETIIDIINKNKNRVVERPTASEKETDDYAVVTFSEFLLLVLDLTINPDTASTSFSYDTSKLLETFQTQLISKHDKNLVTRFYNNLYWYRLLLDLFVIRVQKDNDGNNTYDLNCTEKEDNRALKQYQSMLYVSTTYHRWLKPLLQYLRENLDALRIPSSTDLLIFLKKTDNTLREVKFLKAENMTYGNIDRYWFWRLDYYLWEINENNDKDNAISKYIFRSNRSIEHLHPQDQSENEIWEREDIDAFGNLAMISSGFNSSQGKDPVGVKFSRIKDQYDKKQLQSIKLWKMYECAQGDKLHWKRDMVKEHGEEMLKILHDSLTTTIYL